MLLLDRLGGLQLHLEQQTQPVHLDGGQAGSLCHQKCYSSLAAERKDPALEVLFGDRVPEELGDC